MDLDYLISDYEISLFEAVILGMLGLTLPRDECSILESTPGIILARIVGEGKVGP